MGKDVSRGGAEGLWTFSDDVLKVCRCPAGRGGASDMSNVADLAARKDIDLGALTVSPSRRIVAGPEGETSLEPLVMQVLLLLIDSGGSVVTRNQIFDDCWGGVMVGDDSINRAIGLLRKTLTRVAPGLFEIETIPRTGYRLVRTDPLPAEDQPSTSEGNRPLPLSRRAMIGGGAAIAALAVAGTAWVATRTPADPRFDELMRRGEDALRLDEDDAADYFRQAASVRPDSATAHGLLAYALSSSPVLGPSASTSQMALEAERAARSALDIDPDEPNALLAMTQLQSEMLDWLSREQQYLKILQKSPGNILTLSALGQLFHAVGRCRESLAINERAIAIQPLWPDLQVRHALRLWVNGRVADANRVSDRSMQLWPTHRLVRLARLMIYGFTGRAKAALALIEDGRTSPRLLTPAAAEIWKASLLALDQPTPANVERARTATVEGSKSTPAVAAHAILVLSALEDLDSAFAVAEGFLLAKGSVIVAPKPADTAHYVNTWGWRNTNGLFTPPTRAMRLDRRFTPLVDGLGLTDYWRNRKIGPDAFLFGA